MHYAMYTIKTTDKGHVRLYG